MFMKKILTEILKDEHKIILSLFNELLFEEVNTEQRTIKFALVQFSLLEHLKKEDKYLYPKLRELEGTDQLGVRFSKEMRKISKQIMTFFNNYQHNSHGLAFSKELGIIVATLKKNFKRRRKSSTKVRTSGFSWCRCLEVFIFKLSVVVGKYRNAIAHQSSMNKKQCEHLRELIFLEKNSLLKIPLMSAKNV